MAKSKKRGLASFRKIFYRGSKVSSSSKVSPISPPAYPSAIKDVAMVEPKTSESKSVRSVAPEAKVLQNRALYLKIRVPNLKEEIQGLVTEKRELAEKLKNADTIGPEDQKNLHQRRIYVVEHHSALKAELALLTEERKAVGDKLRGLKG